MSSRKSRVARMLSHWAGIGLIVLIVSLSLVASARAEVGTGSWSKWWLPPDRSTHGHAIDTLFYWIFGITMIIFIATEAVLVVFLIKYRDKPGKKKAYFTHGNPRLEMAWTIAPAIILASLALFSKKAWDQYRYSPTNDDPNRATVLVIGEQFAWNFIYPGPDGKLGRYLLYPKPGDELWPAGPDGQPFTFEGVPGPASLAHGDAVKAINKYISDVNRLGKDFTDPDGKDDNLAAGMQATRGLVLPAHRPIEVQLSSKDVIHDFFLPNFRVKLDAVPGMRGRLFFESTMTSSQRSTASARTVSLDEFTKILDTPAGKTTVLIIDEQAPGTDANKNRDTTGWRYVNSSGGTIARDRLPLPADPAARAVRINLLRDAGLTQVRISDQGNWELVCEELCGQGHNTMTAPLTFLSNEDYNKLGFDKPWTSPTTAPAQ